MGENPLFAAVEAGGTKFLCAVGRGPDEILRSARFDTRAPSETLGNCAAFFADCREALGPIAGLGVGTFGPVQLDPASSEYGHMLATPKAGWEGADLLGPLAAACDAPAAIDTDVNAAALAEHQSGAGRGCNPVIYITVGTGIGGGVVVDGKTVTGMLHPEQGHFMPRRHPDDFGFAGICPFHGDCCEGLVSGPAIAARAGAPAESLPTDHPHWAIVADTIGQLCANLMLMISPQKIILGGGVMTSGMLLPAVREAASRSLNGYLVPLRNPAAMNDLIVAPELEAPGLFGAFLLAKQASA